MATALWLEYRSPTTSFTSRAAVSGGSLEPSSSRCVVMRVADEARDVPDLHEQNPGPYPGMKSGPRLLSQGRGADESEG